MIVRGNFGEFRTAYNMLSNFNTKFIRTFKKSCWWPHLGIKSRMMLCEMSSASSRLTIDWGIMSRMILRDISSFSSWLSCLPPKLEELGWHETPDGATQVCLITHTKALFFCCQWECHIIWQVSDRSEHVVRDLSGEMTLLLTAGKWGLSLSAFHSQGAM